MISERQKKLLVAIVEEYVQSNIPVGSLALSKRDDLNFSSATLRNDMASLEELGYLEKTHTSSGRIPSEKGYRLYVEDLVDEELNKPCNIPLIDKIFASNLTTKREAILKAMMTVSELTGYSTIYLEKITYNSKVVKLEFIPITDHSGNFILVTSQGHVAYNYVVLPHDCNTQTIIVLAQFLDTRMTGLLLSDFRKILANKEFLMEVMSFFEDDTETTFFVTRNFRTLVNDKTHVFGEYNLLSTPDFKDMSDQKQLIDLINSLEVRDLIDFNNNLLVEDNMKKNCQVSIRIGRENLTKGLENCAIVSTYYQTDHLGTGALAVIGPKRMQYKATIILLKHIVQKINEI